MRLSQAWVVARHDIHLLRQRKGVLYPLIGFPLGVAIGFPLLVGYIVHQAGPVGLGAYLPMLIDSFGFWFAIAAVSLPTSIAAYGIVGEKTEKSLEPLLATPTTDGEIFLGKALSAFIPTMAAIWAASALFMGLIDLESRAALGYLYYPNWGMAVTLLVLSPMACLLAIEISVLISARVTDVRSAQQYSGIVFLPFVFLYIFGEIGQFSLNATHSLYIAGILALFTVVLFASARRIFQREEILTRWR
jgi:ABC-2 type transport system permease protein